MVSVSGEEMPQGRNAVRVRHVRGERMVSWGTESNAIGVDLGGLSSGFAGDELMLGG